jgi:hypothetical protein
MFLRAHRENIDHNRWLNFGPQDVVQPLRYRVSGHKFLHLPLTVNFLRAVNIEKYIVPFFNFRSTVPVVDSDAVHACLVLDKL